MRALLAIILLSLIVENTQKTTSRQIPAFALGRTLLASSVPCHLLVFPAGEREGAQEGTSPRLHRQLPGIQEAPFSLLALPTAVPRLRHQKRESWGRGTVQLGPPGAQAALALQVRVPHALATAAHFVNAPIFSLVR